MTGWGTPALIALAAGGLLWRLGFARPLWMMSAAALALGMAGYALQGRPNLDAQPPRPAALADELDPGLSALRLQMFGKYTYAETFFIASDGMIRAGSPGSAVRILRSGVEAARSNAAVWTAMGSAFAAHDGDTVSPAARLSFDQAMRLAPEHPGPPFFLGTAYLRAGELGAARRWWARALGLTPAEARYREEVATRLALLDQLIGFEARATR